MISVAEAKNIIKTYVIKYESFEKRILSVSCGYTLSEDIYSPIDMPPFRQSAMDGYALNIHEHNQYNIVGEIQAGDNKTSQLKSGEAVRIFTGAAVPDTANAVIMQEKVSVNGAKININSLISLNANIRPLGEQVKKGNLALKKGTKLTPAAIGFLTSLGITNVYVYCKPKIAIVATGNELIEAGKEIQHGQIYESNTIMLQSALYSFGYKNVNLYNVEDDYDNTRDLLDNAIHENDIVLITGGISVGDYDFVGKALHELSVNQRFYKVKQKPGKPLYYGQKRNTHVFALPGNPAAALSCFYIYVRAALEFLTGNSNYTLNTIKIQSASNFNKKGNRAQFLKANIIDNKVHILEGQSSAMLQTFALANALVYLSEDKMSILKDEEVEAILIH